MSGHRERIFEGKSVTYSCFEIVASTTASADIDWETAWKAAAPVVVASGRLLDAEAEGNESLIEDAHFQLLRAVSDYKASATARRDHGFDAATAQADLDYVLRWLKQADAPKNIVELQERGGDVFSRLTKALREIADFDIGVRLTPVAACKEIAANALEPPL